MSLNSASTERQILPKHLKPIHYDLIFEPHLEEAIEFDGSSVIDLEVVEETSSITINVADLQILKTEVIKGGGEYIEVSCLDFDKAKERVTIGLKQKVRVGTKIKLKQTFKGSLLHHTSGCFRSPIGGPDGKTKWMVSTQLEATDARRVFPSFDEPALKATFTVTLIADKHLTCLGNMDVASEVEIVSQGRKKKSVTFTKTPLMSTYLVAFAIGNLQMIETDSFRVPIRVYAAADKNIEHGRFGLELASRTLKAFEKIFDIDYPLPKLDLIAVPGGEGAMENWGLVTFGEKFLLVDEKESSANAFRFSGSVVIHELAHQWFGNLVTMQFWDGLWLNESFADWAALYAFETLDPDWQMWDDYATDGYQQALALDGNKASHPIEVIVNKATEVNQIFDDISYNKGCAVIRMISRHLGIEVFVKGVQLYLKRCAYGNSITSDLWDALSEVSGQDVAKIMETWTKHMGYPFITVAEDDTGQNIVVTQHRFLQDGSLNAKDDKVLYPLKLRIRTREGIDDTSTLYERTKDLKLPADFFKINADHPGFYRVLYTPKRLQILSQNVKDGLLTSQDRIGLLSDAMAMAASGNSKTSTVLSLLEVFNEETNFFVWKQAINCLDIVFESWSFENKSVLDALKEFRKNLISKCLHKKGWDFQPDDETAEQMFKALLFSNGGEDPRVTKAANDMFQAFIGGDDKAINVNIQSAVFAIVLENGGEKEYNQIQESIKSIDSIDKRNLSLGSLGYAEQPELIARTLEFAMSPEIVAINETNQVLESLTKHAAGKEALWNWLKADYDELYKKFGVGLGRFARLVQLCASKLSTREQYEDVKTFFEGKNTEVYNVYLAQCLDLILARVKWVERDGEDVKLWLEKNGYN